MALYLVQHGKALPSDSDPNRGLSEEGRKDSERIAGVAAGYGIEVATIIHSGKTRAMETAGIFAEMLMPPGGNNEAKGMGPNDDVVAFAAGIDPESRIMYVGHLPFMEKLVSYLITGSTDVPVIRFQNSGIVCIDTLPENGRKVIKWSLMPHIE